MMPPDNESIKSISDELGVSEQSLYKWRQRARIEVSATPGNQCHHFTASYLNNISINLPM